MADPFAVLGLLPGASKADIKAAFRKKAMAHHPDMHTTASEHVRAANDAEFKVLNEAYQALMDGDVHRYQRQRSAARGPAGYGRGAYTGSYGSGSYAGQKAGGSYNPNYDPFQSHYRPGTGGSYWGYKQYARRTGLDFAGMFRAFAGLGRAQGAATAALGLLIAGGVLLLEPLASSLWEAQNEGKLFSSIEAEADRRKEQRAAAAAEGAAVAAALRAATAARQQHLAAATAAAAQEGLAPASSSSVSADALPAAAAGSSAEAVSSSAPEAMADAAPGALPWPAFAACSDVPTA